MPVTIKTAAHSANLCEFEKLSKFTAEDLLKESCKKEYKDCQELIQSSFEFKSEFALHSSPNAFVHGAVEAYSRHYHLVWRPEDVWFAILAQLSSYVNKHAEELRGKFVAHEGKKELEIVVAGTRFTVDNGSMAQKMTYLLQENVIDPELREWIMPAFTTTTKTDEAVASILMMGTLQKYFEYSFAYMCGIPSVTLLGEKADWETMLARLEKLNTFGTEAEQWYRLLKPVLSRFVQTFDAPDSNDVSSFWGKIIHRQGGSGIDTLSGWITAFCFWNEDGQLQYTPQPYQPDQPKPTRVDSYIPFDKKWRNPFTIPDNNRHDHDHLALDGQPYGRLEMNAVSRGYTSVPVKCDDNGYKLDAVMVAGSVAIKYTSSGNPTANNGQVGLDTIHAQPGWWMFEKKRAASAPV